MGKLEQHCQYWRGELVKFEARKADLEARGDDACSAYDLTYGYNAEFNLQLNANHIAYAHKMLEKCPKPLIEMTPVSPQPAQERPITPANPKTIFEQKTLF